MSPFGGSGGGSRRDVASIKSQGAVGGADVSKTVTGRQVGGDARARPSGGNGGKIRGRARGRPVTACVKVQQATGAGVRSRRPPWLQWGRRLSSEWPGAASSAARWPQARLRRPGSAPAPRPSSPQTLRRPAKQDVTSHGAQSGLARWSALPLRPAGGRAAGWGGLLRFSQRSRQRVRLPLLGRHTPGPALTPGLPHLASFLPSLVEA